MSESFIISKINRFYRKDGFSPAESIRMGISDAMITPEYAMERELSRPDDENGRVKFTNSQFRTMRLRDVDDELDPLKGRTKFGRPQKELFKPYTEEEPLIMQVVGAPEEKKKAEQKKLEEAEPVVEKPNLDNMSDEDLLFERL